MEDRSHIGSLNPSRGNDSRDCRSGPFRNISANDAGYGTLSPSLSLLSNHDVPGFYAPSFRIIRERNERGPRNQISAEMCPWDTKAGQSFEGFVLGWRILLSCPDVSPEGLLNRGYNRPRLESSWRTMKSSECGSISRIEIFFSHRVARMSKSFLLPLPTNEECRLI